MILYSDPLVTPFYEENEKNFIEKVNTTHSHLTFFVNLNEGFFSLL